MASLLGQMRVTVFVATLGFVVLTNPGAGLAQTTDIMPSGLNTQVSAPTPLPNGMINHDITGGSRPGNGPNLFHSFGEFSVGTNHIANFLNETATPTTNILSRVTGGNPSNIFGMLQTTNFGAANLYLINPAGIIFGPTASLNVGGSFAASTADYLRMTDGAKFSANPAQATVLSIAPVAAFGFTGGLSGATMPVAITVKGSTLAVQTGQTLSLVGGDRTFPDPIDPSANVPSGVTMAGGALSAPSGRINMASVGLPANGSAEINLSNLGLSPINGFSSLGSIALSNGASVTVSGINTLAGAPPIHGGTVVMRAGQLTVGSSSIIADAVDAVEGGARAQANAGTIEVHAGAVTLNQATISASSDRNNGGQILFADLDTLTSTASSLSAPANGRSLDGGTGGTITIGSRSTSEINLNGTSVHTWANGSSFSAGIGNAGDITVTAKKISMRGGDFDAGIRGDNINRAGNISINADQITLNDRAVITAEDSAGGGGGGVITLQGVQSAPADAVIISNESRITTGSQSGGGSGGPLTIRAHNVTLLNDSRLETFAGVGQGGDIVITDATTITSTNSFIASSSFVGKGGSIFLGSPATSSITLNGGSISSNALLQNPNPNPIILPGGGNINITTQNLSLANGGQITTNTLASGNAGSIVANVGILAMTTGADISSDSTAPGVGAGSAGTITIQGVSGLGTATSLGLDKSTISTTVSGGSPTTTPATIDITAQTVTLTNSTITAATGGSGKAGDITVKAGQLSLKNGALIDIHSTQDATGDAGSVTLQVRGLFSSQGSTILSTASQGAGGNVLITGGNVQLTDRARIEAATTGPKNAGSIALTSSTDILMRDSKISSAAGQASGGSIKLTAPNLIRVVDSTITSSVQGQAASNGGNINIDPLLVVIQNSQVLANANAGAGGNIIIAASGAVLVDPNSVLSASAGPAGVSGSVNINAPIQVLSGALVPLKLAYGQTGLSGDRCAADPQGQFSSFVQTGRDGVPQVPGALSPSPLSFLETLTSGSWESQSPNLAAIRLGLDFVSYHNSTLGWFHSACRS